MVRFRVVLKSDSLQLRKWLRVVQKMTPNDKKKSLEWPKWPGVIQVMEGGGRGGGEIKSTV